MTAWTPTAAEVHAVIPTRNSGDPFDASSTPTDTQVDSLAAQVSAEVAAKIADLGGSAGITGTTVADDDFAAAKWAATLGTAAYLELNYYPEQQAAGEPSTAGQLFARYADAIDSLRKVVADARRDTANRTGLWAIRTTRDDLESGIIYAPVDIGGDPIPWSTLPTEPT
jgi:hypothetical protein